MIKIENVVLPSPAQWDVAIRNSQRVSCRRTRGGRFEAFCSDHSKYVYLGTHNTASDAQEAALSYRLNRFREGVERYGLNPSYGVVFMNNYVAFRNGMIFNLHGEAMIGSINRCGYGQGIFHGQNIEFHRIIAALFCQHESGRDYVNHKDGDKSNNSADNLEWVTRSENALHAFKTGLQKTVGGTPIYTTVEKDYIREHCFDDYKEVASHLRRSPGTVRKYMAGYRKEFRDVDMRERESVRA